MAVPKILSTKKASAKRSLNSQFLMPSAFPDFEVFGGAVFERKADCRAHRVEAIAACRPRVNVEHPKAFVVTHTQDVAMSADKNRWAQGANFAIHLPHITTTIEADVGHQHTHTLSLEALPLGDRKTHCVVVDVAIDRHHTLAERAESLQSLATANVARTPHLIDLGEKISQGGIERAVQVGYDTYSQHLLL